MRWKAILVGISAVVLAGAGCADSAAPPGSGAGAPPGAAAATPDTPGPSIRPPQQRAQHPPQGATALRPEQVDGAALPRGYPREVWSADGGRTLAVSAQEGGCGQVGVEVAAEGPQRLRVNLVETQPTGRRVCTMDMRYPVLTVQLPQPLDARTVVLHSGQRTG